MPPYCEKCQRYWTEEECRLGVHTCNMSQNIESILNKMVDRIYIGIAEGIPPIIVRKDVKKAAKEISNLLG